MRLPPRNALQIRKDTGKRGSQPFLTGAPLAGVRASQAGQTSLLFADLLDACVCFLTGPPRCGVYAVFPIRCLSPFLLGRRRLEPFG